MSLSKAINLPEINRRLVQPSVALLLLLIIISIGVWAAFRPAYQELVLFFPGAVRTGISGEPRAVPHSGTREQRVSRVVEEILLGPMSVEKGRVFSRGTELRSLLLRRGVLYMDFDAERLLKQQDTNLGFADAEQALKRSINYNFPFVKEIIITVNGQIPFADPFVLN
ncbi:GerMN domain-containing protein [Spirochaeta africana]|uniref:Sporulation/spore germination protein n=1 Tax=Spirochaeta africana (strain ATCC 700263 / DSM 8902 / Z-7692) TaxID=889378 RepID=H9UJN7_SPIAZ|nr:GerMN domain-containing protein [Spirochaeta africana]AFG37730.1 sporulation/spore germination protein [Spirochaeta africana DSM 8902]